MANTKGSDNPFPSVLFAEHVDPANPSAETQRLFVDTDHLLKLRDSAGTVTTFGTGMANPMTTKGDIILGDTGGSPVSLAAGTSGYVLTAAGAGAFPAWAAASGSFIGTLTEATLGADVAMTTANTFYDGPTSTPAAGVYDVTAFVSLENVSANTEFWTARLVKGSTAVDEREVDVPTLSTAIIVIPLAARVTMDGSTAIKITASANARNSQVMKRDPLNNSSGLHRATLLRLTRVS